MADEDEFFSDDDIPINTLDRLEQQAILTSTQRPNPSQKKAPPVLPGQSRRSFVPNAASLNHRPASANRNLPWRPPQPTRTPSIQLQPQPSAPPASAPEPPSSDYGFDDEDVIDLAEPSIALQPAAKALPARNVPVSNRQAAKQVLDPETAAAYAAADAELGSQTFGRWQREPAAQPHPNGSMNVSALQARIAELEAEQVRLRQSEHQARGELRAKQGEITIVRNNHEKSTKQYEARIAVMQRLHADEAAKHNAELESQRKEREKMETNNRFLQHDLAQEAERAKRVNVGLRSTRGGTQATTPRKSRRTALGDGFDDNEVHMVSPSRSEERAKDQTPKAGAKRKRLVNDTPAPELSFTGRAPVVRTESSNQTSASHDQPVINQIIQDDRKYQYLQLIMNHRPYEGHGRTLEALTTHVFPSKPEKTIAAILLDRLALVSASKDEELPPTLAQIMLDCWSRCIQEKFFAALYLILGLLRFAWQSEPPSAKTRFLGQAVSLCTASVDLVARNIVRASTNRSFAASIDNESFAKLSDELVVDEVLDLLLELAQAATLSVGSIEMFWKTIDMHFVLVMLNKAQPLRQILIMLQILATSSRPTSFGVIAQNPEEQAQHERSMVDRLTNMLFEYPLAPEDEPAYSENETLEMRIEVLKVMREMCFSDHGALLLTSHRSAIGRLIRFLDAQVSKLYRGRPSLGISKPLSDGVVHILTASTVNQATRIVYHVFRMVDDPSTIIQRLNAVHGGYHKFLICLTRIAFTEQLVFEHGIDNQASEAAHKILDEALGPEDGDAVMKAIETPRGTRGSTTEKNTTSEDRNGSSQEDTAMSEPG